MSEAAAFRGRASGSPLHQSAAPYQSTARRADEPLPEVVLGLARARQRVSLFLAALVSGFGFVFALATGFAPAALRIQVMPGLSWMMVSFFTLVAFIFAMVGIYVFWAARYYDADWMLSHLSEGGVEEGGS
jgi:uncharacterized membrane protein (DUF485 family)